MKLKNPFLLSLLQLVVSMILGVIFGAISMLLNFYSAGSGLGASIISAMVVGLVYAYEFHEVPSRMLRVYESLLFLAYQIIGSIVVVHYLGLSFDALMAGILGIVSLIVLGANYLLIGYGANLMLKTVPAAKK